MKTKSLLLAFAGLGLFACSNEDLNESKNLDGNGVVEVKIVAPSTRSELGGTPGNNDDKVTVNGTITVKLTAGTGSSVTTIEADGKSHTVKFYGVKSPSLIEAYVNGGDTKAKGNTAINELQMVPSAIPAYGSTRDFNLTGTVEENGGKKYEMYEAAVTMQIPVARLEVSGIKHVTHPVEGDPEEASCKYETLTIDGIYLDKVKLTAAAEASDFAMPAGADGTPAAPILGDEITSESFLTGDTWPKTEENVYAYNFYTGTMPILKIYFANATASDENNPVSEPRYAVIKTYNGEENFEFKPGHIYRIKDVTLKDKNIIGDEEGNPLYGVDVTVTEAQWTIADISGEWVEQ